MEDILPPLLEKINQDFDERAANSKKLKQSIELLKTKKTTYLDVNDFAIEVGEILANVFSANITAEVLPEGKMYYNIAERILNATLRKNYDLISSYASNVQTNLNNQANLKLKAQLPDFNQDRVDGLVNRVSSVEKYDDIKWILDDPIVNFSQSIVDDSIKTNIDFHASAGLSPTISRKMRGDACDWCRNLAGTYNYHEEPADIYHRHQRCRCTVEYNPKDGRGVQNSHTKKWRELEQKRKIEERQNLNLKRDVVSNSAFDKTNMKNAIGNKNYTDFLKSFDSLADSSIKTLLQKMGNQLEFNALADNKNFVRGNLVQLSQAAFDGTVNRNPLQIVYHELGHSIDNLGIEAFDSEYDRISEMPKYKLRNDIKNDLLKLFNNDLSEIKGDDYQKLKNLKKMDIFDQGAIVRKYKKLAEENPKMYSSLSDMMESTGAFIHHPLGSGHGLNYWKPYGIQEAEFFAHMTETVANEDSRKMMYELFPTASKKWEQMLEDILEAVK